jgi:hypothetical protein
MGIHWTQRWDFLVLIASCTIQAKPHPWKVCWAEKVAMVLATSRTVYSWCILVEVFYPLEPLRLSKSSCSIFQNCVSTIHVLTESMWTAVGGFHCTASKTSSHQAMVTHITHSLKGKNQSYSKLCVDVEKYDLNGISLQQPYSFHCTIISMCPTKKWTRLTPAGT